MHFDFSIINVLRLAAVVLFVVAFGVAMTWWSSNWEAWTSAALFCWVASELPWHGPRP